jgi:hypothetical protein
MIRDFVFDPWYLFSLLWSIITSLTTFMACNIMLHHQTQKLEFNANCFTNSLLSVRPVNDPFLAAMECTQLTHTHTYIHIHTTTHTNTHTVKLHHITCFPLEGSKENLQILLFLTRLQLIGCRTMNMYFNVCEHKTTWIERSCITNETRQNCKRWKRHFS